MIDIDAMERRMTRRDDEPLLPPSPEEVLEMIAEIRRLQAPRKCQICGSAPKVQSGEDDRGAFWWVSCTNPHCYASGQALDSESAAWAAWDGVE
jgi:hypothetical protein